MKRTEPAPWNNNQNHCNNKVQCDIWGAPDDAIATLHNGQPIEVIYDGRSYKLMERQPAQMEPPALTPAAEFPWSVEKKRAIATKIDQYSDLMGHCLNIAAQKFGAMTWPEGKPNNEDLRALATTLFIQAIQ
ncbi:MAG: hypothetical protein F6K19_05140 [Cyanothece sp. SIO1E1]|nr:hypothetical protein [Cyanothece sp. SIO1E1]